MTNLRKDDKIKFMKNLSLKFKTIVFSAVFLFISFTIMTIVSVSAILNLSHKITREAGIPIAKRAAAIVDPDKFMHLAKTLDESDRYYENLRVELFKLKSATNCKYLYTMVPKEGTVYTYIVDGSCDPSDTENFSPLGTDEDIASYGEAPFKTMREGTIESSGLQSQDEWGWTSSVYAPIKSSDGTVIGIVGADFDSNSIVATITRSTIVSVIVTLFLLGCLIAVLSYMTTRIFGRVKNISAHVSDIASGKADLSHEIPVGDEDEIGELAKSCNLLNKTLLNLVSTIKSSVQTLGTTGRDLEAQTNSTKDSVSIAESAIETIDSKAAIQSESVNSVFESTQRLNDSVNLLNGKISTQTDTITNFAATVEQLSGNTDSIDKNVNKIYQNYNLLVQDAETGRKDQLAVSQKVHQIVEQSSNLSNANKVIDDISQRTNLLAMNASIEAAHAGEAGKGFAIVAQEIRMLAENSSKQSQSINELISTINDIINDIVRSSNLSTKSFENVTRKIREIEKMLQEVHGGIDEQQIGTKSMLDSMAVIKASSQAIEEESVNMKRHNEVVFSGIETLRSEAQNIKELSQRAADSIFMISGDAEKAIDAARKNNEISDQVMGLLKNYKTT